MKTDKRKCWNLFLKTRTKKGVINLLYDEYVDDLIDYGFRFDADSELIKDAIHDMFVDLYKYKDRLDKVENIQSYLFKAFKNKLQKIIKENAKVIKISHEREGLLEGIQEPEEVKIYTLETTQLRHQQLNKALLNLPNKQREVIQFKFHQGKDYPEIAEIMGISVASARTQLYRGLKSLKTKLG